jgi:hypothetical protein
LYDPDEDDVTATRLENSAITRGAEMARPGAGRILGGLLLLTVP